MVMEKVCNLLDKHNKHNNIQIVNNMVNMVIIVKRIIIIVRNLVKAVKIMLVVLIAIHMDIMQEIVINHLQVNLKFNILHLLEEDGDLL